MKRERERAHRIMVIHSLAVPLSIPSGSQHYETTGRGTKIACVA